MFMANDKIAKLMKAIKSRIIEIQIEDRDNPLTDNFSSLYAVATKILNNDDVMINTVPNNVCMCIGREQPAYNAEYPRGVVS
jgi:hypothetical protein